MLLYEYGTSSIVIARAVSHLGFEWGCPWGFLVNVAVLGIQPFPFNFYWRRGLLHTCVLLKSQTLPRFGRSAAWMSVYRHRMEPICVLTYVMLACMQNGIPCKWGIAVICISLKSFGSCEICIGIPEFYRPIRSRAKISSGIFAQYLI